MQSWYKEMIEPEIRGVVKLLRKNGFNTTCSCGHDMYVQGELLADGEINRLDCLLFNHGHRNYEIVVTHTRRDGHLYAFVQIDFKPNRDSG